MSEIRIPDIFCLLETLLNIFSLDNLGLGTKGQNDYHGFLQLLNLRKLTGEIAGAYDAMLVLMQNGNAVLIKREQCWSIPEHTSCPSIMYTACYLVMVILYLPLLLHTDIMYATCYQVIALYSHCFYRLCQAKNLITFCFACH